MDAQNYLHDLDKMAADYDKTGNELAKILIEKSSAILMLMATSKSIKEAEMKFGATEAGKKEIELTYKLRGLKELIAASKMVIRTKNAENYH